MSQYDDDMDEEVLRCLLANLKTKQPPKEFDERIRCIFNATETRAELISQYKSDRYPLSSWKSFVTAIACVAIGVIIGRLTVDSPGINKVPMQSLVPSNSSVQGPLHSEFISTDRSDETTDSNPTFTLPENLGSSKGMKTRYVGEDLVMVDGLPVKRVHMISAKSIKVYSEESNSFVTRIVPETQFVMTPDPGA